MKRRICAFLTMLMMLLVLPTTFVHAEAQVMNAPPGDSVAQPLYTYTSSVSSTLSISGTTATCSSTVKGSANVTKIVATQYLQKKVLWWWTEVDHWSKTVNKNYLSMTNTKTGLDSGTYRVVVEATVYCGDNSENVSADSVEVKVN